MSQKADVVIVGGAVMGSAVAYFLSADPDFDGRIVVLEKDQTYSRAASALSTSGIRQQFSSAVNIALSRFTVEFLRQADLELGVDGATAGLRFHENGYLYLGQATAVADFQANNRLQRSMGADVQLLDRAQLHDRFPWLTLDDIEIGSLGLSGEGWTDGYALMMAFKAKARANGVEYRYAEVTGLLSAGGRITGARCDDGTEISAGHVVNAAGGSGRAIAHMAGVELPVRRVKQVVFAFESPFRADPMPYVLTPDRLFFRPEGQHYIAGLGIEEDAERDEGDLSIADDLFVESVWPKLAFRVAGFEQLRPRNAWSGHYDMNTFDHNAIVGAAPGVRGFYLANGFSGHGLMQAPGVGRALAELIVHGGYRTLDLSDLSFERIAAGRPVRERIQY